MLNTMQSTRQSRVTKSIDYPILDIIKKRWSPRMFSNQEVASWKFMTLLEAARWAPSSFNLQPWRFIYAHKGSQAYENIFQCLSDFNQSWVRNAPILMMTTIKEDTDEGKNNYHALHDLGLSMGNFTIQAQSMGIAVHQMAGIDWEKAHEIFEVPEGYHVVSGVAVGYYGGDPSEMSEKLEDMEEEASVRKPMNEIARENSWWS